MAEQEEIVLVNHSKGRFTINFQGAFPQNKTAVKGGKYYLSQKEFDWLKSNSAHILEGDEKRLYLEGEDVIPAGGASGQEEMEAFFDQHHTKVKSAIGQMNTEEAEAKYKYAQLNDVSAATIKALEDRILELDKQGE